MCVYFSLEEEEVGWEAWSSLPATHRTKAGLSSWNPGQKQNYFLQRKVETGEGLWLGGEPEGYNASLGCSGFGAVCVPPHAQTQTHEKGEFLPFRLSHTLFAVSAVWKSILLMSLTHKDLKFRTQTVPLGEQKWLKEQVRLMKQLGTNPKWCK